MYKSIHPFFIPIKFNSWSQELEPIPAATGREAGPSWVGLDSISHTNTQTAHKNVPTLNKENLHTSHILQTVRTNVFSVI